MYKFTLSVLIFGFAVLLAPNANAETFLCSLGHDAYSIENSGVGVYDRITARCEGQTSGFRMGVRVSGYGLAIRLAAAEAFTLICPFRSGQEAEGVYYGVKADAQILVGARVGFFYSKENACIMTGLQAGAFGASVVGAELELRASSPYDRH